ncbi:MAG TPA: ABC transporter ATP-binding protein [Acidimicrobiales bacterium]
MAAVEVESLTVTYGTVVAVDDLSFQADAGEVTCVLGPNGAGKTSTVESLEGLRRPTGGRLSVIGLDPRTQHRALTERMGVMLQEGGLHPAVRVGEALRHAAALYRRPVGPGTLVDRLGLAGLERRTIRRLSGGERRRLALALALVGRPQVVFLDEPTAGVDPGGRQAIRQVVADLRGDGVTVVMTTHDLDEAERVADRIVIIVGGRLVAAGSVDDLTRATSDDEHVRFRAPAGLDRAALSRHLEGAEVAETAPGEYAVATAPTPRAVAAITAWLAEHDLPLADLRAGRQRLEDVYLRLTAEGARPAEAPEGESPPELWPPTESTLPPEPTPLDAAMPREPTPPPDAAIPPDAAMPPEPTPPPEPSPPPEPGPPPEPSPPPQPSPPPEPSPPPVGRGEPGDGRGERP